MQTQRLGPTGNQISSYEIYDVRIRPRQTQEATPVANGGRMIDDTMYDGGGLAFKHSNFWNNAAPGGRSGGPCGAAVEVHAVVDVAVRPGV